MHSVFIMLAVFAVDAAHATCETCQAASWSECRGNKTDCGPEMSCVFVESILTEVIAGKEQTTPRVARGCARDLCDKGLFANFRHTQRRMQTRCDSEPVLPPPGQPNGKKCFGCVAAPSECTKTVDCRDEEKMCISVKETVGNSGNLMVIKGCATESMCRYGQNIIKVLGEGLVGNVSCCEGNLCNSSVALRDAPTMHFLLLLLLFSVFI